MDSSYPFGIFKLFLQSVKVIEKLYLLGYNFYIEFTDMLINIFHVNIRKEKLFFAKLMLLFLKFLNISMISINTFLSLFPMSYQHFFSNN